MPEFVVIWKCEIDAEDAKGAAEDAEMIMATMMFRPAVAVRQVEPFRCAPVLIDLELDVERPAKSEECSV